MKAWVCSECGTPVELYQPEGSELGVYCPSDAPCTPRQDGLLLNDDQVRCVEIRDASTEQGDAQSGS